MKMPTQCHARSEHQRGLSLIEVLVAIVILSIGLLGLAGMQASSLRSSQSANYSAQAMTLAEDIIERMRANPQMASSYARPLGASAPTGGITMAARDLEEWFARVQTLPAGDAAIQVDTTTSPALVTVTVRWDDSRAGTQIGQVSLPAFLTNQ